MCSSTQKQVGLKENHKEILVQGVVKSGAGRLTRRAWPQPCPHACLSQGRGRGPLPKGPQRLALDVSRPWVLLCTTLRKQKSPSGKHRGELSRKKVLEVSKALFQMLLSWGRSSPQPVPTLPEPQFCLRGTLASNACIPPGLWSRWGESPGMDPKGLRFPPSTQSASRCLASGFSLTSEGTWRTWRVHPVPDPRRDWPEGSGGGASYGPTVEEATACLPSPTPAPGGRTQLAAPWMRAEHKAHCPRAATGPETSDETVRLERESDGQAGHRALSGPPLPALGPGHQLRLLCDPSPGSLDG